MRLSDALLAVRALLGGLIALAAVVLVPAGGAGACSPGIPGVERIPAGRATAAERQRALRITPEWVEVARLRPPPADAVVFYGTALEIGSSPSPSGDAVWTFAVERVVQGEVRGPAVQVVAAPGPACGPVYQLGKRQAVVAIWQPGTGQFRGVAPFFMDLGRDPGAPDPAAAPSLPAVPALRRADAATRIVLAFLAAVTVLGLAGGAGAVYLRARELDLEARELALRERGRD